MILSMKSHEALRLSSSSGHRVGERRRMRTRVSKKEMIAIAEGVGRAAPAYGFRVF